MLAVCTFGGSGTFSAVNSCAWNGRVSERNWNVPAAPPKRRRQKLTCCCAQTSSVLVNLSEGQVVRRN